MKHTKSWKSSAGRFRPIRLSGHACAALCASALLVACATPSAAAPNSSVANAAGSAESAAFEDTFRRFTACDAGFFKSLHDHAKTWAEVAPLGTRDGVSWIQVKNRYAFLEEPSDKLPVNATLVFSKIPAIAGLKLLSYTDGFFAGPDMGGAYVWGFTVEGSATEVARKIKPLVLDSQRFQQKREDYFERAEIKLPGGQSWLAAPAERASSQKQPEVERTFTVETDRDGKQENTTFVGCSLHGAITGTVLKDVRPDIDAKEYLDQSLSPTLFEDTVIPDNVIESINAARAGNPLWMPKFKKLKYSTKERIPGKKSLELDMEVDARPDGLLRMRDNYEQEINFGGLVLLKSRSKISSPPDYLNSVHFANSLSIKLPAELAPGAVLVIEGKMENRPFLNGWGMAYKQASRKCEVKERLDASIIFPVLSGKAARIDCKWFQDGKEVGGYSTPVYLEDLGMAIYLGKPAADGSFSRVITKLEIER